MKSHRPAWTAETSSRGWDARVFAGIVHIVPGVTSQGAELNHSGELMSPRRIGRGFAAGLVALVILMGATVVGPATAQTHAAQTHA